MSHNADDQAAGRRTKWWVAGGVAVVLVATAAAYWFWPSSAQKADDMPVQAPQQAAPPRPHTIPNMLEDGSKSDIADLNTQAIVFGSVRIDDGAPYDYPAGTKVVYLRLRVQENVLDLMEQSEDLAAKFFPRAFGVGKDVRAVYIDVVGPIPDRYGHRYDAAWITYIMGRKTFEKIDWSGFDNHSLCDFLNHERIFDDQSETFCGIKHDL